MRKDKERLVGIETNPGPGQGRTNRRRGKRRGGMNKPPQIKSNIIVRHVYRFVSQDNAIATPTALTPTSLLCAAGTFGITTNTTVRSMFQSVRVNKISAWAPSPFQGTAATVSVEWVGSISSQLSNLEISDTSNSVSTPAIIHAVPPHNSLASFWQQPSNDTLCTMNAPSGTIIDIDLSLILQDDDTSFADTTVATAVVGDTYYLSLDPNATHLYTPVSLRTTF
jgi:hypothetical protein